MGKGIQLIAGLGNPGSQYENTRHNAGAWLVERLARQLGTTLSKDNKFSGLVGRTTIADKDVRLIIPTTYMNRSGQAIAAIASFYKIPANEILVAHDELDLDPGVARLKSGGGHGGHNGLRDTIAQLGNNKGFLRLRVGIGHPGDKSQVHNYVLSKAQKRDQILIDLAIDQSIKHIPEATSGHLQGAMNKLNGFKASLSM